MKNFGQSTLRISWGIFAVITLGCAHSAHVADQTVSPPRVNAKVRLVKDISFKTGTRIENEPIGGLSGLVFAPKENEIYAISDDRGDLGDPRIYGFKLQVGPMGASLEPNRVVYLRRSAKESFKRGTTDTEGIALSKNGHFLVSSEGSVANGVPPTLFEFSKDGLLLKEWPVPKDFLPDFAKPGTRGIRHNLGFEPLTRVGDFVLTANEQALFQDGETASQDRGSSVRIVRYDRKKVIREFKYQVERLPNPAGQAKVDGDNGLVDFVAIDENNLITLERAHEAISNRNTIRLFKATLDPVKGEFSKELMVDLDQFLNQMTMPKLDNIEGMAWGPILENGNSTLIVVSDNNFSEGQRTLFMIVELLP